MGLISWSFFGNFVVVSWLKMGGDGCSMAVVVKSSRVLDIVVVVGRVSPLKQRSFWCIFGRGFGYGEGFVEVAVVEMK